MELSLHLCKVFRNISGRSISKILSKIIIIFFFNFIKIWSEILTFKINPKCLFNFPKCSSLKTEIIRPHWAQTSLVSVKAHFDWLTARGSGWAAHRDEPRFFSWRGVLSTLAHLAALVRACTLVYSRLNMSMGHKIQFKNDGVAA